MQVLKLVAQTSWLVVAVSLAACSGSTSDAGEPSGTNDAGGQGGDQNGAGGTGAGGTGDPGGDGGTGDPGGAGGTGDPPEPGDFPDQDDLTNTDMLTPEYYQSSTSDFREEVNEFLYFAHESQFANQYGDNADYDVGRQFTDEMPNGSQNHPATDMHPSNGDATISVYAAHAGRATLIMGAPKYRDYIAVSTDVTDGDGNVIGQIVTIHAHLELTQPYIADGTAVAKGELIQEVLYEETRGGPHLHFEIRYYRAGDDGTEEFYGGPNGANTAESLNGFVGYWDPTTGYGFGNPLNHGLSL